MPATKQTTSAQQNAKHTKVDFKKTLQSNFLNPSMQSSAHTFERFVPIQSHLNLLNYTHWSRLNTLYFTQVFSFHFLIFNSDSLAFPGIFTFCLWLLETVVWQVRRINHNSHEALLEIPEGRFSEPDLLNIHSVSQPLFQLGVQAPCPGIQKPTWCAPSGGKRHEGGGKIFKICQNQEKGIAGPQHREFTRSKRGTAHPWQHLVPFSFLYLRSKPPIERALSLKLKLKSSFRIYSMRCSGGCQFKTEMVKWVFKTLKKK